MAKKPRKRKNLRRENQVLWSLLASALTDKNMTTDSMNDLFPGLNLSDRELLDYHMEAANRIAKGLVRALQKSLATGVKTKSKKAKRSTDKSRPKAF